MAGALKPLDLSQNRSARARRVPPNCINSMMQSKRSITADAALRLARALWCTPQFWLNIQTGSDL
ncbi:MAG: HigA family addiction module antitoxin [Anaerolineales bacterium]|nr:HigA family addiction module antitoxin [Anaerolineales bacterium]